MCTWENIYAPLKPPLHEKNLKHIKPLTPHSSKGTIPRTPRVTRRSRLNTDLVPNRHDPLMLQQLDGRRPLPRIPQEAFIQEIDAASTELVRVRQLRRIALGDVEHDGPLVVE